MTVLDRFALQNDFHGLPAGGAGASVRARALPGCLRQTGALPQAGALGVSCAGVVSESSGKMAKARAAAQDGGLHGGRFRQSRPDWLVHVVEQRYESVRVVDGRRGATGRLVLRVRLRHSASHQSAESHELALHDLVRRTEQQRPGLLVRDDAAAARPLPLRRAVGKRDARPPGKVFYITRL